VKIVLLFWIVLWFNDEYKVVNFVLMCLEISIFFGIVCNGLESSLFLKHSPVNFDLLAKDHGHTKSELAGVVRDVRKVSW
jgi:hypothetical protein